MMAEEAAQERQFNRVMENPGYAFCRDATRYAIAQGVRIAEIDTRSRCALFEQDQPSDPSGRNPHPTNRWYRFF